MTTKNNCFGLTFVANAKLDITFDGQSLISAGRTYISRITDGSVRLLITAARPDERNCST